MVESNEVVKNDFELTEMVYHMKNKKYLVEFYLKGLLNLLI